MHHWDRGTSGRLQRISAPIEQGSEISVPSDQMDPLPKEQQSQQGTPMNPTAYRSMRDHIHPPRVSAPSCIIPPVEDVAVRPYLVPLLPTYHGMKNENPYCHAPRIPAQPDWRVRTEFRGTILSILYIGTLFDLFFLRAVPVPIGAQTISVITKIICTYTKELPPEWCSSQFIHIYGVPLLIQLLIYAHI